ncbi:MAG: biotin/lipoyl-binding protein, partial [Actinomycetota bacterium]|nr:biotin/lipoyl-binding protein [Actinomycetota bacterium]
MRGRATLRRALGGVAAALVLVGGGIGIGIWVAPASSSTAAPAVTTTDRIETVSTGTVSQRTSSTGTIEPATEADVNFAVAGRVTAVDVAAGQAVSAGQTLATVDPSALQATLALAQATLASDQARLATDTAGAASSTQLASDQASVTAASAQVSADQQSLDDATLTAPVAGTVASVDLAVGQQVGSGTTTSTSSGAGASAAGSGGAGSGGGSAGSAGGAAASAGTSSTAQFVVVSTGSYVVDASVDDTQVGAIKIGDQAVVTPSGATSPVYGTIATIGLVATQTSGVASFPVVVDVTGSPSGLYAGASATVEIVTEQLSGVLVVPTTALRSSGGSTTVQVVAGGHREARPVQVGLASGGVTQITSGLVAGEQIVVPVLTFAGRPAGAG